MTITNTVIINDALKELGVVAEGETATAPQGLDALRAFNQMMAVWVESDMDFGWFPQDTLSDTAPVPTWAEDAVIANLAKTMASKFRAPVTPVLQERAVEGRNHVARTLINMNLENADMEHLPRGDGRYDTRNILNDV